MLSEQASAAMNNFRALCDQVKEMARDHVPEMFVVDKCIEQGHKAIKQYEATSAPVMALKDFVKNMEDVAAKLHAWNKAAAEANSRDIAELIRLDEAFDKLVKEGVDDYGPIDDLNSKDDLVAEHEELREELVRVLAGFPDNGTS